MQHKVSHAVSRSQNIIQKEATRLSSGKRLASSADDSAGKAVETHISARIRSHKVAQRNTDYARNLCEVAQGGLGEIQESVLRLQTLAVQSANDSLTDKERGYLQKEANELLENINDVALKTRVHEDQPLLNQVPVDIGFVIDTSNSMGGYMATLKTQIDSFADNVKAKGFNVAFGLSKASSNATNGDPTDVSVLEEDIGSPNFDNALNALNIEGVGGMDMYSSMINAGVTDHPGQNDPDKFGWRTGSHRYLVVLTDTAAQESFQPPSLPGNPSQADVANQLAAGDVTAHILAPTGFHGGFNLLASVSGGTVNDINDMANALTTIETAIENDLDSVAQYVFQTGVDGTADDRVQSGVAIDATVTGLQLGTFDIGTREDAHQAIDDLQVSIDLLNEHFTTYGTLQNKLERLSDNTATMIQSESQSLSSIKDADFAESSAQYAMAKVRNENSVNVLRLYGEMKTSLVNNLLDSVGRSVRSGLYAGLA